MRSSESLKNLAQALVKAQAEIGMAELDALNPFFKNKYATLPSIVRATRPAFSKNGLAITMLPVTDKDGRPALETIVMHASGEWYSETAPLILSKNDMQQFGASVSYLKRIALSAVTGAVADEDDDGNAAVGNTGKKPVSEDAAKQAKKPRLVTAPESIPEPKAAPTKAPELPLCRVCDAIMELSKKKDFFYCPNWKDADHKDKSHPVPVKGLETYLQHQREERR